MRYIGANRSVSADKDEEEESPANLLLTEDVPGQEVCVNL